MNKRTILLYGPFIICLPAAVLLYITVEIMLNAEPGFSTDHLHNRELAANNRQFQHFPQSRGKDGQNDVRQMAVLPRGESKEDRLQTAVLALEDAMQGDFRRNKGQEGELQNAPGKGGNDANGTTATFPPFVEGVGEFGEGGLPVTINVSLLTPDEKADYDAGWKKNSFNQYVSDRISIKRSLPHGWSEECKKMSFRTDLPEVSVIIIFHNEAWSVLLRSVHSVLSRTPSQYLKEVILVDDFSTFEYLKAPLDQYWRVTDSRVRVIHAKQREGLTRARLIGYDHATAPVLVFFDSHIECFPGWFEPLAERIASHPNVTVFPSIEAIDAKTLAVVPNHHVEACGVFRWRDLTFQWGTIPPEEKERRKSSADPIRSPTMPGGLFAISHDFFTRLGTYDPGLLYWGGENVELSFKAWMCWGSVELVPCSHVGHIFRGSNPIKWHKDLGLSNVARVAHVWMDDYKNYFLERNRNNVGDYGDISDRVTLREKLKCRDFAWFVKNVKPIETAPVHVLNAGQIKLKGSERCIDSYGPKSERPKLYGCHGTGGNQFWYLTADGLLFQDDRKVCEKNKTIVLSQECFDKWNVTRDNQISHSSGQCLEGHLGKNLTLNTCDINNKNQIWETEERKKELIFPPFK